MAESRMKELVEICTTRHYLSFGSRFVKNAVVCLMLFGLGGIALAFSRLCTIMELAR